MIWLNEINRKLVTLIRENIKVTNESDELVAVNCEFVFGEGEGEDDSPNLPKIGIRIYDLLLDKERVHISNQQFIEVSRTDDQVTMDEAPEPYLIFYEFIVVTEYYEDMVDIITQIQQLFPPRGTLNIEVPDSGEPPDTVDLYMECVQFYLPRLVDSEKTKSESRRLRRFKTNFRYLITANLFKNKLLTYYITKNVGLETNKENLQEEELLQKSLDNPEEIIIS